MPSVVGLPGVCAGGPPRRTGRPITDSARANRAYVPRLAIGLVLLSVSMGGLLGCNTHACDESYRTFEGGRLIDDDTWETSGLSETWIAYPGQGTWTLTLPASFRGRDIIDQQVYVAVAESPNAVAEHPDSWALASGNLAEWRGYHDNKLILFNGTCGEYYARVVVRVAPSVPSGDAGVPADASHTD